MTYSLTLQQLAAPQCGGPLALALLAALEVQQQVQDQPMALLVVRMVVVLQQVEVVVAHLLAPPVAPGKEQQQQEHRRRLPRRPRPRPHHLQSLPSCL